MRRTKARSDGLRQQLLADYRRTLERFRIPGKVYDKEVALASGAPVVVDSSAVMCALLALGLPHGDYTHDGKHGRKLFLLDEFDRLTEHVDE